MMGAMAPHTSHTPHTAHHPSSNEPSVSPSRQPAGTTLLEERFRRLPTPRDYYAGHGTTTFAPPQNILFFYRDRFQAHVLTMGINHHFRHVLILNCGEAIRVAVDGRVVTLQQGHAMLILPYQYHRFLDGGRSHLSLLFVTFEMEDDLSLAALGDTVVPYSSALLDRLHHALSAYEEGRVDELPFAVAVVLAHLMATAATATPFPSASFPSSPFPPTQPGPSRNDDLIKTACRVIAGNRRMTAEGLARTLGYSDAYLRRTFHRAMGVSLGRYITENRLMAAMKALSTTTVSVGEIADAAGYDNVSSFCRAFRRHVGTSPTGFRRRVGTPVRQTIDTSADDTDSTGTGAPLRKG